MLRDDDHVMLSDIRDVLIQGDIFAAVIEASVCLVPHAASNRNRILGGCMQMDNRVEGHYMLFGTEPFWQNDDNSIQCMLEIDDEVLFHNRLTTNGGWRLGTARFMKRYLREMLRLVETVRDIGHVVLASVLVDM